MEIKGTILTTGEQAPSEGFFLSIPEVRALDAMLADLEGAKAIAEAKVVEGKAEAEALRAEIEVLRAELVAANLRVEVETLKLPTFWERHLGFCVGIGGSWNAEDTVGGVTALYGFQF